MNFAISYSEISSIMPEITLISLAKFGLILDLFGSTTNKRGIAWFSLLALVFCGIQILLYPHSTQIGFWNMVNIDKWSIVFKLIFVALSALTVLVSIRYLEQREMNFGEYYVILLFATAGMMFLVSSQNLLMIFIGLEILSISTYVLIAMQRNNGAAIESALKYFLLGGFATGFLLFGIALVYGATGSLNLGEIAQRHYQDNVHVPFLLVGMILIICGLGFKIAAAPFHMWSPDVYEGAPTPVTAFMSAGPKAAGFAALAKILLLGFAANKVEWSLLLGIIAVLTMTIGNLMALVQDNIKRMLAYSSISHVGYLLVGVIAGNTGGVSAMAFYLFIYALMSIGAFGIIILFGGIKEPVYFKDFSGIGFTYPAIAIAMMIFMLSLAGIPFTAGFVGKFQLFQSAIRGGYTWLVIIGVLNSVISVFYYLKIIVSMYMKEPAPGNELKRMDGHFTTQLGIISAAVGIVIFGLFPQWLMHFSLI